MEGNIFEIQKSLEEEMTYVGVEKFQKQVREAKSKGTESITLHGILLKYINITRNITHHLPKNLLFIIEPILPLKKKKKNWNGYSVS